MALLTVFVLAVFVGFEVIAKVSSVLHTPLMSGANAIHGVILVGAIIATGHATETVDIVLGLMAVLLATLNLVGGFVVTDRMLEMFGRGRRPPPARATMTTRSRARERERRRPRLLACRGLFHHRAQGAVRPAYGAGGQPDRRFRCAAGSITVFAAEDLDHIGLILATIAVGAVVGAFVSRRVAMTAMPQLVAAFNGVGGGAAALVALIELCRCRFTFDADRRAVHRGRRVRQLFRLGRDVPQAAGADHPRPITFPAAPTCSARWWRPTWAACGGPTTSRTSRAARAVVVLLSLVVGVLFVLPVGGADVPIVISLLNAFTGLTVAASGYVLSNTLLLVAGTLVGASGTILTRMMAQAMGRSVASILFGAFRGGSTAGSTEVSDRPVSRRGRRTSRSCSRTRARW